MTKRHRSAIARRILASGLLVLAASATRGEGDSSADGQCAINAVFGTFATGGYLFATGFAFDSGHGAPVRKVDLILDGKVEGEVSLRGLRPDVLAHFARQDYLWSGWNGEISLDGVTRGEHFVDIVATSQSGKRIPCGRRSFSVLAAPEVPNRATSLIGAEILLRTTIFLCWLTFVGWTAASLIGAPAASAPLLGFALFGVLAEAGGALHIKPALAALILTVVSLLVVVRLAWTRRIRLPMPSGRSLILAGLSAAFAIVAVIPLASHGEGAVLGDIDDASRECVVADSYSRFGWSVPTDVHGYLTSLRGEVETHHVRPGGIYLLSGLADAFRTRAHAVHSVAMLATGCLVVWGAGFLAGTLSTRRGGIAWLAAALVAVNSTLVATLYGQHLGSLLGAALLLPFLAFCVRLVRLGGKGQGFAVALLVAAGLVFYPEALPVWALAAPLSVLTATGTARRRRAAARLALALVLGAALNPVGAVRFFRFARDESRKLSRPYDRMITGDTHYFPSPTVILGIEAYREDAAAPVGAIRSVLIPVVGAMIVATAVIGWRFLRGRERAAVVLLLAPVSVALLANVRLSFPYGYAKFLPMAAAVWSVAFALLALRAMARLPSGGASRPAFAVALASVILAFFLALPSLRHVLNRAMRSVPAYDPAYRVLPALAEPIGRSVVIVVDEPIVASREWIRYFFGENAVFGSESLPPEASSKYLLVDRRRDPGKVIEPGSVSSRIFALEPLGVRR